MGPAIFVMAIMGCGEAEAPCLEVGRVDARYESREACVAETEAQVLRHAGIDYPVVVAQCLPAGARPAELRPSDIALPEPERTSLFRR